ncbi:Uncharacterised protein [Vibrio cholerae]|nr:Uncharacterised protein [Vibrio cholerae]CSC44068.1 Uncharacterised protein [Vibrio cholerae]CSI65503.1 Uncharacterised protein [Vibrio cholerae]
MCVPRVANCKQEKWRWWAQALVILSYSQSKHSVISNKRMWCSTTT